jgi:hypothetical protein
MINKLFAAASALLVTAFAAAQSTTPNARPSLPTCALNAITDVAGVEVGHTTIIRGDNIRTGVTAVLPHSGNHYREKVPAAILVGNGFGKLTGSTQVDEMDDIETPILLTSTTSVPLVADSLLRYMLALPGNEDVLSINPVVGETNDGYLSDIRGRHTTPDDVVAAIKNAKGGPVEGGAVGAGTGTAALGLRRAASPPISVDIRLVCLCRRISAASSPLRALPSDRNWANTICVRNYSRPAAGKTKQMDPA